MPDAEYPEELLYHPEHDWARIEPESESDHAGSAGPAGPAGHAGSAGHPGHAGLEATLGVTWFAQDALGEVVFVEPPALGTTLTQGAPYAEVESVKAVSDVVAPLSGEIVAVNEALAEDPQAINEDPYGEGWLVRIKLSDPAERERLLDAAAYVASLGGGV